MGKIENKEERILRITKEYDERIIVTMQAVTGVRTYNDLFDENSDKEIRILFDNMLYLFLSHLDMLVVMKHLEINYIPIECNYFARSLYLNCNDVFDNFNRLTGSPLKKYRSETKTLEIIEKIDSKSKEINKIIKENIQNIRTVRNKLIAHKDGTGFEQSNRMLEIKPKEIFIISKAFVGLNEQLILLIFKFIQIAF